MTGIYIGGIEGGATHSKLVICGENGQILSTITGLGTNHWMLGIQECARRIADMVNRGKTEANIPLSLKLNSLGLSLSGCEQESSNNALERELRQQHPEISEHYVVCSDTYGSVFTSSPLGGLVLIAGTGSNAFLSNPDGKTYNCGGWGNFLADEGSAWWISHRAMKTIFDHMDNLFPSPYPINAAWDAIKSHFGIQSRLDLLDHCYAKFDKPFFAGLCVKLAEAAENGDELCLHLFNLAGQYLAKAAIALFPNVNQELVTSGDLSITCVGSVWRSWHLLKQGFLKELHLSPDFGFGLRLLRLTQAMAMGAVYLAADSINFNLPRNYEDNYEIFHLYHNKQNGLINNGNGNGANAELIINSLHF